MLKTLTKHDTHNRHPCPAGFEHAIPASEWPQTQALDGAATGTGIGKAFVMLYYVPRHGDVWQQGGITPRILYIGTVLDGDELPTSRSGRDAKERLGDLPVV